MADIQAIPFPSFTPSTQKISKGPIIVGTVFHVGPLGFSGQVDPFLFFCFFPL